MGLIVKCLMAAGLTTTPSASEYSPGAGKSALVKSILFVNTHENDTRTVTATFTKSGGTAVNLCPQPVWLGPKTAFTFEGKVSLSGGDKLQFASNGTGVDCIVSGLERD